MFKLQVGLKAKTRLDKKTDKDGESKISLARDC